MADPSIPDKDKGTETNGEMPLPGSGLPDRQEQLNEFLRTVFGNQPPAKDKAAFDRSPSKPPVPAVQEGGIPQGLRKWRLWVCWRLIWDGHRWGKVPVVPATGNRLSWSDPAKLHTFEEALALHRANPNTTNGIGFIFAPDCPFTGIDIDNCRNTETGAIESWARAILDRLNSYSEVSPSGTGVKVWVVGVLPDWCRTRIEYHSGKVEICRHFACTGLRLGEYPGEPAEAGEALLWLAGEVLGHKQKETPKVDSNGTTNAHRTHTPGRPGPIERATLYLRKEPVAISGQLGHNRLWHVTCIVVQGFNIREEGAYLDAISEYNRACVPPWSPGELLHKFEDALEAPCDKPLGYLLNQDRPDWQTRKQQACNNGPSDGSPPDGPPPQGPENQNDRDTRPVIVISTEEHCVNNQAIDALACDPTIFCRGGVLVTVQRDNKGQRKDKVCRPIGTPRIVQLRDARLRELLTLRARWVTVHITKKGEIIEEKAHPPHWSIAAVSARGQWDDLRTIAGIVESPTLRPDGTILDQPGWDPDTCLLYEPATEYPLVSPSPTQADARQAAHKLLELISDFPVEGDEHRVVWLAALLSALGRPAVDGPIPLFLFDANCPGSGKSLMCDIISWIVADRPMARTAYTDDDEEFRKRITAVALAGDNTVLLDNLAVPLGSPSLDAALTGRTWRDRILGRSEITAELPLNTIWFATGNNTIVKSDGARRTFLCRLRTEEERPEERDAAEFRFPRLVNHVRKERPALVAAGLTILRAYFVAGRPAQGLQHLGSFEEWSDLIRSAVYWATGFDPAATRQAIQARDTATNTLIALLKGWAELPGSDRGLTAGEALRLLQADRDKIQFIVLRDVLAEWARSGDLPSAGVLGSRLRSCRDRVCGGFVLRSAPNHTGAQAWRVVQMGGE